MFYILSGWSAPVIRKGLGWAASILAVCALLLGVAMGANWLSHQNWGGGPVGFHCTGSGETLTWHSLPNGDIVVHCAG